MENKLSLRASIALGFYRGLYALCLIPAFCVAPILGKFSRRIKEGFNDYFGNVKIPSEMKEPVLWVHGVSMGESMVALGFAKELRKIYPNSTILFTTTHPDVVKDVKKKEIADSIAYFPLDNYRSMNRLFNRWRPNAVFVSETDFWPEFSNQCRQRNIPLMLINGRISSKITSFYTRAKGLAEVVFGAFTAFAVQTRNDADNLLEIGVPLDKIHILGNMKADFTHTNQVDLSEISAWLNGRKLVVFGSLHPEEFEFLRPVFKKLASDKIAVIIAPRNITLADSWVNELNKDGVNTSKKTELKDSEIIILDTIGELASVYKLSSASFVGGSLDHNKTGGHNPLEVLQQNVPLVMGPYYRNFADIVEQLKKANAIEIINNAEEGYYTFKKIINDTSFAEKMTNAGNSVLNNNKGVVEKTINLVNIHLSVNK
jgi:3-deoxy-D-manno-octulosonic-acid transferase